MIVYKSEDHDYSNWPYWYTGYAGMWNNRITHQLMRDVSAIKLWANRSKIDMQVTSKGTNFRFSRAEDRTAFLLRWT